MRRRQYRMDLKADPQRGGSPCTIAEEVDDVLAVARAIGEPVVLYGHSDGGVVALEALAAEPSAFVRAVVFEPAAVTESPLAGENGRVLARARAALAAGRRARAMGIFFRGTIGLPAWQAVPASWLTTLLPRYRRLVPGQLDSLDALDRLGDRLDTYAGITVPTVLLSGDRSPAPIIAMIDAVARAMPRAERVIMHKRDHGAPISSTPGRSPP